MMRLSCIVGTASFLAALTLLTASCGGSDGSNTVSGTDGVESALSRSARQRRKLPPPPPPPTNVNAAIAAAQTPDGQAIPQAAGPNGQCPEVVVLLGFWSCPTIGQTCSFQSSGVTHNCVCVRTDGEGQNPSWVCDQPTAGQ
jgi:hypothetical protein